MSKYIRLLGAPLALCGALMLNACGDDGMDEDSLLADSALANDLTLAGQDSGQPGLSDEPATSGRSSSGSRTGGSSNNQPSRPSNETSSGNTVDRSDRGDQGDVATVPSGTSLVLASNSRICTNTNKAGDRFTATVSEAVTAGGVTIPAGARAVIQITNLRKSENATEPVSMSFNIVSLSWSGETYLVTAEVTSAQVDADRTASGSSDAKKVIGGAVVGAIIGQVLGKDTKSTVIGAATGAAAGTAVAMGTGDFDGCIPENGRIAIRLTAPVEIRAE
ncbi:MAG: YMGG-like glycine zipper-containing protein [Gemmatimonadales bacterium]